VNGQLTGGFAVAGDTLIPDGDGINLDGTAGLGGLDGGNFVIGQRTDAQFNTFEGTVDDTALYNYALSPKQVASHYANAPLGPTVINLGAAATLTWSVGVLQESGALNGVYTNVTGAVSPYTITFTGAAGFFRTQVP
jgi:hypothetical protein